MRFSNVVHVLKTTEPHFTEVWNGQKLAELRVDDREPRYKVDDVLLLRREADGSEWQQKSWISCRVTHVLRGSSLLAPNVVMLSIEVTGRGSGVWATTDLVCSKQPEKPKTVVPS